QPLTIDVLGNDTDGDDGHAFTLTSVSAPGGKGTASVFGNQGNSHAGSAFDHLAQGVTAHVTLSYAMQDEFGAASSSTVDVTITGTNDGPVAVADVAAGAEDKEPAVDVVGNQLDGDEGEGGNVASVAT